MVIVGIRGPLTPGGGGAAGGGGTYATLCPGSHL
jgi:hypothetical protein